MFDISVQAQMVLDQALTLSAKALGDYPPKGEYAWQDLAADLAEKVEELAKELRIYV